MRNYYPFFLECSKRETNVNRRRHLELLCFGKGGVILDDAGKAPTYVTDNGRFEIPTSYSDSARDQLNKLIWNEDTDFYRMEKNIKDSIRLWTNVKKRDKLRIIDKYVLQLECDIREKKLIKSVITIALILRLLESNDIVYQDFEIKTIGGTFNVDYFAKGRFSPGAKVTTKTESRSHTSSSACKISAKDIWQRVCASKLG